MFDIALLPELLPMFLTATGRTLLLLLGAFVGAFVLGFALNWLRERGGALAHRAYWAYVGVMRGLPFLILLFIAYFGLPSVGVQMSPYVSAVVALSLYGGAYFAEIFRACWQGVPAGQVEAARIMGISASQVFWRIQAPQAMRAGLPLMANQTVLLLKDCALASVITYPELAMTAGKVVSEQFVYLEPYLLLALCYWALALSIDLGGRWLTRRFVLKGAVR